MNLEFIENSKKFKNAVQSIVGKDYIIKKKSIIRSVPKIMHPKWVLNITKDVGRPNVNPYVREKYQDVQYFQNVDYHQDMTRGQKFVTFYVYLDEVSNKDSPLKILKGSYRFPSISEYIAFIVKSLLDASSSQLFENSTFACLPSVDISFLSEVISNLLFSIIAVIVPCSIPVS